jgi:hypothetical protein
MVTVFVAIIVIMSVLVIASIVAAMTIVPVITIIQVSAMAIAVTCFVLSVMVTQAVGLGVQLFQSLLLLFLLELVKDATCAISVLALLKEADERDVFAWEHFMHLRLFLLMCFWHQETNLLNFFLLHGQLHHCLNDPFLEVAKRLHLVSHVIVRGHECLLSRGANQWISWLPMFGNLVSASR